MAEKAAAERSLLEGESIRLTLDMPPSANRYWRSTGRVYVSENAELYKADVSTLAYQQGVRRELAGDLAMTVRVYRKIKSGDLDNRLKVLLDALKGVAFTDDKQIVEIHAYRFDDARNPRVEVEIEIVNRES